MNTLYPLWSADFQSALGIRDDASLRLFHRAKPAGSRRSIRKVRIAALQQVVLDILMLAELLISHSAIRKGLPMKTASAFPTPRRVTGAVLGLTAVLGLAGCATPPAYPDRPAADCVAHRTGDRLVVGVHPLFDRRELNRYFGSDLVSAGMLPVLIVVENRTTDTSYLLSARNCMLSIGSGLLGKEHLSAGESEGLAATLIGGPVFGTAIMADAGSKRTGLAIKELRDQTVSPGQTEQGFVYVKLPRKPPTQGTGVSMRVVIPRLGGDEQLKFELPFTWEK